MTQSNIVPIFGRQGDGIDIPEGYVPASARTIALAALYYGIVLKDRGTAERLFNSLLGKNLGEACVALPEDLLDRVNESDPGEVILVTHRALLEALESYGEGQEWRK